MTARRVLAEYNHSCPQLPSCEAARRVPEPSYPSPEQIGLLQREVFYFWIFKAREVVR